MLELFYQIFGVSCVWDTDLVAYVNNNPKSKTLNAPGVTKLIRHIEVWNTGPLGVWPQDHLSECQMRTLQMASHSYTCLHTSSAIKRKTMTCNSHKRCSWNVTHTRAVSSLVHYHPRYFSVQRLALQRTEKKHARCEMLKVRMDYGCVPNVAAGRLPFTGLLTN